MKKLLSLIAVVALTIGITSTAYAKNSYNVSRLYGVDRYKTSVSISSNYSSGTLQNVIIASGKDFADALAGSVLSKKLNAPILLAGSSLSESADSIQYIKDHLDKNGTIYLLGGAASVSEEFINYMKAQGYNNFQRLGGLDRFSTNKEIVNFMNVEKATPVVIANAYGFADALSVSSIAALKGYPIIMTSTSSLPTAAKDLINNIQPSEVYIIGGNASVGDNVISEINKILPSLDSSKIIKLAGQNRYETSLSILKYFELNTDTAVIANGTNFPDALSGSALAAKINAPIVLIDGKDITKQRDFMDSKNYKNLVLLGGFGAVDFPIEYSLKGPENITAEERQYIDNLISYSESYITKSANTTNYVTDSLNKVMGENNLINSEDPSSFLYSAIQLYKDFKISIEDYEQELIKLRDQVSSLQAPNGLESLKQDYINNINLAIKASDKAIDMIDPYIEIFNSLMDAVNSENIDKIEQTLEQLEQMNKGNLNELNALSSEEQGIKNLKERLEAIKLSMN